MNGITPWEAAVRRRVRERSASELDQIALKVLEIERELEELLNLVAAGAAELSVRVLRGRLYYYLDAEDTDFARCKRLLAKLGPLRAQLKALGEEAAARYEGR